MLNLEHYLRKSIGVNDDLIYGNLHSVGGLFLHESVPASFVSLISQPSRRSRGRNLNCVGRRRGGFLSVTASSIKNGEFSVTVSGVLKSVGEKSEETENEGGNETVSICEIVKEDKSIVALKRGGGGTLNVAKHLWAGAVAAMVSSVREVPHF